MLYKRKKKNEGESCDPCIASMAFANRSLDGSPVTSFALGCLFFLKITGTYIEITVGFAQRSSKVPSVLEVSRQKLVWSGAPAGCLRVTTSSNVSSIKQGVEQSFTCVCLSTEKG